MQYFGIDSATSWPTIKDRVIAAYGTPHWIGRYLFNYSLNAQEVQSIFQDGLRILPIDNGTGPTLVTGTFYDGYTHGRGTLSRLYDLRVPTGVSVAIDIETGWNLSKEFAAGYVSALSTAGYLPVAYLNPNESATLESWQATDCPLYVSEPEYDNWANKRYDEWLTVPTNNTLYHQYWENSLDNLIDLDQCTQEGFVRLWYPRKEHVTTMLKSAGMKHYHRHGGPNIMTLNKGMKVLDTGIRFGTWALVEWYGKATGWVLSNVLAD